MDNVRVLMISFIIFFFLKEGLYYNSSMRWRKKQEAEEVQGCHDERAKKV